MKSSRFAWCVLVLAGCAAANSGFKEPKGSESVLVIGSVIVDLFQYRGTSKTYRDGIDVVVAGRIKKDGKVIHKNYWVKTDERGYFALSNIPDGEYAVRGFRIQTFGPSFYLTVASSLVEGAANFVVVKREKIPGRGAQFNFARQGRIVDLRHNYFILDRGEAVHHETHFRYDDMKMVTGKIVDEPDVLTYFKNKYNSSQWFNPSRE